MKNKKANSGFDLNIKNNLVKSKLSQVTIFIIIAVLIVLIALLIFFLWRPPSTTTITENPQFYIESCVKESAEEAIDILSRQGGDIKPELSLGFMGENLTYLCYYHGNYKSCVNQRPMLIEHLQDEISEYVEGNVSECFSSLKAELEDKGYTVSVAGMNVETELQPERVVVNVDRKLVISRRDETRTFEKFDSQAASPLYELAEIAMEIVNQEAEFCNFENLGFMITYPRYDIRKDSFEGSLIYTITDLETQHSFKFAVRTCVMPAGL